LSHINQKKEKNRCVACKRDRRSAINEQVSIGKPCDMNKCGLRTEIADAIEEKFKVKITKKEITKISITKIDQKKIVIIKK